MVINSKELEALESALLQTEVALSGVAVSSHQEVVSVVNTQVNSSELTVSSVR